MERGTAEARAAAVIRRCRDELARRGSTVVAEAIGGGEIEDWRHYPDGEAYDPDTHAQYFYHRHHAPDPGHAEAAAEHGHFHLFLRAEGVPAGILPLLLPELAVANVPMPPQAAPLRRGERAEVTHLVAVAVDRRGEPVRLFTTNRWVTGETWYRASDVARMLHRFEMNCEEPSPVLNRWLGALVHLFRAEIAALLQERDDKIMGWRRRRRTNVFEDPRLEIASGVAIDLDARLAMVDRRVTDRVGSHPVGRVAPRLPSMSEGWGE